MAAAAARGEWEPPSWSQPPHLDSRVALQVRKEHTIVATVTLAQFGAYIFGRNTDGVTCGAVLLEHDSISRRHAAIVHDMQRRTHLIDLGSRHGTLLDGKRLAPRKYAELNEGSIVQFGASTRVYEFTRAASPPAALAAPAAPSAREAAGPSAPAGLDLEALRRLGPAARATLSERERRALESLAALEDEEDPMRNYTDDPDQDLELDSAHLPRREKAHREKAPGRPGAASPAAAPGEPRRRSVSGTEQPHARKRERSEREPSERKPSEKRGKREKTAEGKRSSKKRDATAEGPGASRHAHREHRHSSERRKGDKKRGGEEPVEKRRHGRTSGKDLSADDRLEGSGKQPQT